MQYKPKKPKKWGLNVWTLAGQDGYVYNWDLYAGKPKGNQAEQGLTFNVVTKLCRPIYNKGHHVFMDNYFSSPALFDELSKNQTGACGTLRLNQRGIPKELKNAKPPRGEMITLRNGDLLYICWTDKRQVNILASVHNSSTFHKRVRCKRGQGELPNDVHRIVVKPKAVEIYTKKMGGVDRADQKVALHISLHQTIKWWKKLFFHVLETAVVNASVIYKSMYNPRRLDPNKFCLAIVYQLIPDYDKGEHRVGPRFPMADNPLRLQGRHFPCMNPNKTPAGRPSNPDCTVCPFRDKKGRHQTSIYCAECEVPLCAAPCFKRYHTLKDYRIVCSKELHH